MAKEYSEDTLIEETAIDLFLKRCGWDTAVAYNKETFGEDSTLGRLNKKEVVLKRLFLDKLKEFNPDLPQKAYDEAYEKLIEESSSKSLAVINFEKHQLLRGVFRLILSTKKANPLKIKRCVSLILTHLPKITS